MHKTPVKTSKRAWINAGSHKDIKQIQEKMPIESECNMDEWRGAVTKYLCKRQCDRFWSHCLLPFSRLSFYFASTVQGDTIVLGVCGGSYHISDGTAAVFFGWFLLASAHSEPRSTLCHLGTKRGEKNKKRPVLLHTGYGEKHQKANGTCSLKKVISVPFMYKKYESKNLVTLVLSV